MTSSWPSVGVCTTISFSHGSTDGSPVSPVGSWVGDEGSCEGSVTAVSSEEGWFIPVSSTVLEDNVQDSSKIRDIIFFP